MSTDFGTFGDLHVTVDDDFVVTAEIRRPPNNFFSPALIDSMVDAFQAIDDDPTCRAIVLCSEGKHFCAGADFGGDGDSGGPHDPGLPQVRHPAQRQRVCHESQLSISRAGRGRGGER